jgi:hypothetical protein
MQICLLTTCVPIRIKRAAWTSKGKPRYCFQTETVNAEDKDSDLSNLILDETCCQLPAVDALLSQGIRNKEGRRSPTRLSARKKVSALGKCHHAVFHMSTRLGTQLHGKYRSFPDSTLGVSMTGPVTCDFGSIYTVLGSVRINSFSLHSLS